MRTDKPTILPSLVQEVPLFAGFEEEDLRDLLGIFQRQTFDRGESVSEPGEPSRFLRVLISGRLSVQDETGEVMHICPPAPVGELNALAGEAHSLAVVATESASLLAAPAEALQAYLLARPQMSMVLHQNLLQFASVKMSRDRRRLREMRSNIVKTQHAMKRMRAALSTGEDTPLHAELFDELEQLIEQNRKIHYLVEPSRIVPTEVHLSDGAIRKVTALSPEWLHLSNPSPELSAGQEFRATLRMNRAEIPVSGRVVRVDSKEARVNLDELIPEYRSSLQDHLAKVQLFDTVL